MADPNSSFGKYEIVRQVGRGGFATVYLARDTTLKREVALKLLHPYYATEPEMAQRFLEEAQTAANLNHPNIITVFEVGDLDGQLFLAMEYVADGALQNRLEQAGPLGLAETVDTLSGIADALDYAHSQGLVHRDIKPANILLKPRRQNRPWPVLTDFGLVKALSHSTSLTRSGAVLGTVEYMAPEQIDSDRRQEVGPASDLYALGIVAYHMLTGQVPFSGSTVQVINGHLNKQPPAPAEVRADLPAAVSTSILRAIAKAPADRYPSATAFVEELGAAARPLTVPPPVAPPPWPQPQEPTPVVVPTTAKPQPRQSAPSPAPPAPGPASPPAPQPKPAAANPNRLMALAGAGALVIIALLVLLYLLRGRGDGSEAAQSSATVAPTAGLTQPAASTLAAATAVIPPPADAENALLHSTLDNLDAILSPAIGSPGRTNLSAADFTPARSGNGAIFPAYVGGQGKWLAFPVAGNFDPQQGEVEFWYRPNYAAAADDASHYLFVLGPVYGEPQMYLEEGDDLELGLVDNDYVRYKTASTWRRPLWQAGQWLHIRAAWDAAQPGDALAIYVDGQRVDQGGSPGGWDMGLLKSEGTFYVGSGNDEGVASADGVIDEFITRSGGFEAALAPTPEATPTSVPPAFSGSLVFTHSDGGGAGTNEIYRYDLASGQTVRLTNNNFDDHIPRWSPDGSRIVFTSNRTGVAGAYDLWTMNADGSNQQAYISTGAWDEYAAWEPSGHKLLAAGSGGKSAQPTGKQQPILVELAFVTTATTQGVANAEIFVGRPGAVAQQTYNASRDEWPSWSPDGSALVYGSERNDDMDIYRLTVDLPPGQPQALYVTEAHENQPAWSPVDDRIAFIVRENGADAFGRLMLGAADGRAAVILTEAFARDPAWSPDGAWIIFSRGLDSDGDESDLWAIRPADGLLAPVLEAPGSDGSPSWIDLSAVAIQPTPTPVPPTPTPIGDWAQITGITVENQRYVVEFVTSGFEPRLSGSNRHVHFFFDTVAPEDAGMPGNGPWQIYPTQRGVVGASPFTLYRLADRPSGAHRLCILVANSDHSVRQGTGNCLGLP